MGRGKSRGRQILLHERIKIGHVLTRIYSHSDPREHDTAEGEAFIIKWVSRCCGGDLGELLFVCLTLPVLFTLALSARATFSVRSGVKKPLSNDNERNDSRRPVRLQLQDWMMKCVVALAPW